jgi:hypothetical protein
MRWKGKLSLFCVNSGSVAGAIFYSPRRTPIPFSFLPIGVISAPENIQPTWKTAPTPRQTRPARSPT